MTTQQKGFTLVEILIVLCITFTLLLVSSAVLLKVKEEQTLLTYVQQFKLLTYEAYSIALNKQDTMRIRCIGNTPNIHHMETYTDYRTLTLPTHLQVICRTDGPYIIFYKNFVDKGGLITFNDKSSGEQHKYTLQFSYGRFKKEHSQ